MQSLDALESKWPSISWREPLPVRWPHRRMFACRICIANLGLDGESPHQWPTEKEANAHIATHSIAN